MGQIAASYPKGALDEHAVPAYLHPNFLARWLFWKRLAVCQEALTKVRGGACLDLGCGSGPMLPLLVRLFSPVYAVDPNLEPARQFMDLWEQATGTSLKVVRLSHDLASAEIPPQSLKVILALDVLEHVDDLDGMLVDVSRLLSPDGTLLVSGPTESRLYRLGRRVAGFSGHYHVRNVTDVMAAMERLFTIRIVKRLVYPFTFFYVCEARKK
jgi:2-polyprenyl-3-methyl-5-hydroxy-6-metoxy-1,4-benzoquinol methylase